MRARVALLLGAAVLAGCGGSSANSSSSGGSVPAGASLVPAGAPVFISITSDLDAAQAKQADELLKKFPARDRLLREIKKQLGSERLDYESDIKPALGPEVDLVILDVARAGQTLVGLTKPADTAKLEALLKRGDDAPKAIKMLDDGWVAFGDDQASVEQIGPGSNTLADTSPFEDAMDKLPAEALAKGWADGESLVGAVKQAAGPAASGGTGEVELDWLAAALEAQDDGVSLRVVSKGKAVDLGEPYASALLGKAPAGSLAFATFRGGESLGTLAKQAGAAGAAVESFLGVSLEDLVGLFAGENALYLRSGTPLPEVTLVLGGQNGSEKLATLTKLGTKVVAQTGKPPRPVTVDGVPMTELPLGPVSLYFGLVGGQIVISDSRNAVLELRRPGVTLADDESFKAAQKAAGMPDKTNGFLYVNLKDTIPEVERLAGDAIPADIAANLRPLRTLVVYAAPDGDATVVNVFLELQ